MTSWVLAATTLVLTVGTFAWQTPLLGLVGSLGGHLPGWVIIIALVGAATGAAAWTLRHQRRALAAVLVCLLGVAGGAKVITDQVSALEQAGLRAQPGDFFGPSLHGGDGPDDVVEYGPVDGTTTPMGVYRPTGTNGTPGAGAPVAVLVHGGGFTDGDITSEEPLARYLTDRGYLVFTPTYRLATEDTPTWDVAPAQVVCAIVTAATAAASYGGDSTRLHVGGSSAGGNLAPLAANHIAAGEDLGTSCGPLPDIRSVALTIAATDPGVAEGTPYALTGPLARDLVETYTGGTPEQVPDRYAAVNATATLPPGSPPTLLVYGENDWLVSSQASLNYAQRARALDVPVQTVGIPWTGHLIGLNGAGSRAIAELTLRWFNDY